MSDAAVRDAVSRACGLCTSHVCRHVYKGVDLGERVVRVGPPLQSSASQPLLSLLGPDTAQHNRQTGLETGPNQRVQVPRGVIIIIFYYRNFIAFQMFPGQ